LNHETPNLLSSKDYGHEPPAPGWLLFKFWPPIGDFQKSLTFATATAFGVTAVHGFLLPKASSLGLCKVAVWYL
jgi:hypothetical protein